MIHRITLLFALLILCLSAAAQPYVSRQSKFQVDQKKGCTPFTVTATSLLATGPYSFDFLGNGFGNNAPEDQNNTTGVASFTYTTPGKYLLRFCVASSCNAVDSDDIEIEVVANIAPAFDLYACSNNGVQVKVTDSNYNQYVIDYDDGSPEVVVPSGSLARDSHTFPAPAGYTVFVRGRNLGAADNCVSASSSFTAQPAIPQPAITSLASITANSLDVSYSLATNVLGRLDIATNNNATYQQLKNIYRDNRDTLTNVNNNNNFYCVRVGATDACSNTTTFATSVCSSVFSATALDGVNQLDWTTNSTGVTSFTLNRDGSPRQGMPATLRTTTDNGNCNVNYCYQLVTNYPGATATSLEKCVTSFSTAEPPAVQDINASFTSAGDVELSWTDQVDATEYLIAKNENGSGFRPYADTPEPPYLDISATLTPACYQLEYDNACNVFSDPSIIACPVVLSATVSDNNEISLSWTSYQGWQSYLTYPDGVTNYRLRKYSSIGVLLDTYDLGAATTTYLDATLDPNHQEYLYEVTVTAANPALGTVLSNRLLVTKRPNLYYPTAFTPDGTGPSENERFRVFGQYISTFQMKVFNRWGELVFTSNDIDSPWNGQFRGIDQPEGTYTFVVNVTDYAGRPSTHTGAVVLMRQ